MSGSYDKTIKIWDRRSGTLVADLTGGHTGRILCIAFDKTKVVSCGEDYICTTVSSLACMNDAIPKLS